MLFKGKIVLKDLQEEDASTTPEKYTLKLGS